jgi:hypothetical protein
LSLYPDESLQVNYLAQAYYLTDLKSVTLHLLVEQLGLADPERFAWTLHNRDQLAAPPCPLGTTYLVVQRNFGLQSPSTTDLFYSPYVNDVLFTYFIEDDCAGLARTIPFSPDPEAVAYTAVAANDFENFGLTSLILNQTQPLSLSGGLQVGYYYNSLTKDDLAAIKYIYATNNVNYETPDPASLQYLVQTNTTQQQLFPAIALANNGAGFYEFDGAYGYGDYGALEAAALIDSPAVLTALYPGIQIASSYSYFGYVTNYTYTQYFTNTGYGTGYPPPLVLATVTNKVVTLLEKYATTFANVFTNKDTHPTTVAQLQNITVTPNYGVAYPAPPVTNITTKTIILDTPSGYFFVEPMFQTNPCPIGFIYTGLTNVLSITNYPNLGGTNLVTATNIVTSTNTFSYTSTLIEIINFTNYIWVTHPVACSEAASLPNYYQGNGGVKFQRVDYDSYITQYFTPITNYYSMVVLTNFQWQTVHFVRIVTQPDILMNAADLGGAGDGALPYNPPVLRTAPNFVPSPLLDGLDGPGTIDSPTTFTYNRIGDSLLNGAAIQIVGASSTSQFLGEVGQYGAISSLAWASFGPSTNAPELYPNGASIQNLESELAVTLSPASPPAGSVGSSYVVQFTATGGGLTAPLKWTATPSPIPGGLFYGLPPGLGLSSSGLISGTPASAGIYDFVLTLTDSAPTPHVINWNLSITVQ